MAADKVRRRDAREAAKALYQLLRDYDENEKASKLYESLPYVAQEDSEIYDMATKAYHRVRHITDRTEYLKLYTENTHWEPSKDDWIMSDNPQRKDRMVYILSRLKESLPNGGRVLDVGCSDGFHSLVYAKNGYEVVGMDIDPRCVNLANERAEKWNLSAKFVSGFFEDLDPQTLIDPFDSDKNWFHNFDAVICSEVIEHVQDPAFFLGCLGDCAKDDAPIILTTPFEAFDKGDIPAEGGMYEEENDMFGHLRVYTQATFEALLRSHTEFYVTEARFVPYKEAYREKQGWLGGELRRTLHPQGPVIKIWCGDMV